MKKALVLGGSGGIGRAIAKQYAQAGYEVIFTYLSNEQVGREVAEEISESNNNKAIATQLDVTSDSEVKSFFESLDALDVMVYAIATDIPKSVDNASFEEWKAVTGTMVDGAFLTTHYAVPLLAKSENPNIIYLPSMDGIRPDGTYLAYQVSEASFIAMTKGNAKYLGKTYGIRVNAVCPGPVRTGLWDKVGNNTDEQWNQFAKDSPLGRVALPEDIARACLSLSEDSGKFLNGNLLFVDGGSGL
jgi:NAD(P)-dependent dehydrogenase (short-subunit alcohol dehydrogenase family)